MPNGIRWIPNEEIQQHAEEFLFQYWDDTLPVDVEYIAEYCLKVRLGGKVVLPELIALHDGGVDVWAGPRYRYSVKALSARKGHVWSRRDVRLRTRTAAAAEPSAETGPEALQWIKESLAEAARRGHGGAHPV